MAKLSVWDAAPKGQFEVKPSQVSTFQSGPPLELTTTCYWQHSGSGPKAGQVARLELSVADCEGRKLTSASTGLRSRPLPPRFKIVSAAGKTIQSGSFEYG
jgi:hypothetical protein